MIGGWYITPHALRRYRERVRPDATRAEALHELVLWSEVAPEGGSVSWPREVRFVVGQGEGDMPALVTVTAPGRPTWIALHEDVEREFAGLVVAPPWTYSAMLRWEAVRRATYAHERQEMTAEYARTLARARQRGAERRARIGEHLAAAERERHARERARRVAGRVCPECGSPVPAGTRGPTPVYCSRQCSHRVASRRWWRAQR